MSVTKTATIILMLIPPIITKLYPISPEVDMTMMERVRNDGYSVVPHKMLTEDGYILGVYHIFSANYTETETRNRSTALLIHAIGGAPENFVVLKKDESLPYYLIERGVDVWIFCSRSHVGPFKERHTKYDWDRDPEYWDYSMDELGKYDIKTTIDVVLNYTGQTKLSIVGHSAGGPFALMTLCEHPLYNEKVKVLICWGGSPIVKRIKLALAHTVVGLSDVIKKFAGLLGIYTTLPFLEEIHAFLRNICSDSHWDRICFHISSLIGSHKSDLQREEDLQVLISSIPRFPLRQVYQYIDNIKFGVFRRYDYGPKKNMQLYGRRTPPDYNLSAVTAPVAFFNGPNDDIVRLEDVIDSVERMPNVVAIYRVKHPKYQHTDYIFGRDADRLVCEPTYEILKNADQGVLPSPLRAPITADKIR